MQISDAQVEAAVRAYNRSTDYIFTQATPSEQRDGMRAALEAALSLPVQPVAWRIEVYIEEVGRKSRTHLYTERLPFEPGDGVTQISEPVPLYANPAPPTKGPEDDLIAARDEEAVIAGWNACRRSIYAVCEDVQSEAERLSTSSKPGTASEEQHAKGYYAGSCYAAKSIARGFSAMDAMDDDNVQSALRSRPASALPVVGDVGKPLVWSDVGYAHTGFPRCYHIELDGDMWILTKDDWLKSAWPDKNSAKAAAQADYEARILSALTHSVQP